jgi:hypothetical protein
MASKTFLCGPEVCAYDEFVHAISKARLGAPFTEEKGPRKPQEVNRTFCMKPCCET